MYIVAEEDNLTICATIVGMTEIYPQVSFVTTTLSSDSGKKTLYHFVYSWYSYL